MKKLMHKTWFRLMVLLCYCALLILAVVSLKLYQFASNDGWYETGENLSFAKSRMCINYVGDCLEFVRGNILWQQDPTIESLGSYGGEAFSYRIKERQTGVITADTTTDQSEYVSSISNILISSLAEPDNPEEGLKTPAQSTDQEEVTVRIVLENEITGSTKAYAIEGYVNIPVEPYDGCYREYTLFQHLYPLRDFFMPALLLSAVLAILALLFTIFAEVNEGKQGNKTLVGHIPVDAVILLFPVIRFSVVNLFDTIFYDPNVSAVLSLMGIFIHRTLGIIFFWCLFGLVMAIVSNQITTHSLKENLLIIQIMHHIPTYILIPGLVLLHILDFVVLAYFGTFAVTRAVSIFLIDVDLVLLPCLFVYFRDEKVVLSSARALASGDLTYKVNAVKLHRPWNTIGEYLNQIGDGMTLAVEEKMRSEHMKTELITNVSHDLKTPLTSIISYIALLKNEKLPAETQKEYLDVLERQGAKLKKLTEDVIEASKAASKAIKVNVERLDLRELLEQSVGEYSDKLQKIPLEIILHVPEHEVFIAGDVRLLGRVLDNFLTNMIKYAMPGTRAYFDLTEGDGRATIAVKNISKAPLDIPAEELMERFVQGDRSRYTEGSGLGLSIARSLIELMDGQMTLTLDGDLFKVEISFSTAADTQVN